MAKIINMRIWKITKQAEELNKLCRHTELLLDYVYDFSGLVRENHEIDIRKNLGASLMDAIMNWQLRIDNERD